MYVCAIVLFTMNNDQTTEEKQAQTQHVRSVAYSNLCVVVDQLASLDDKEVKKLVTELETISGKLQKLIKL